MIRISKQIVFATIPSAIALVQYFYIGILLDGVMAAIIVWLSSMAMIWTTMIACNIREENRKKIYRESIDINKPQVFSEPIKCWVRDTEHYEWSEGWLTEVRNSEPMYACIQGISHNLVQVYDKTYISLWKYCTLTKPKED